MLLFFPISWAAAEMALVVSFVEREDCFVWKPRSLGYCETQQRGLGAGSPPRPSLAPKTMTTPRMDVREKSGVIMVDQGSAAGTVSPRANR